MSKMKTEEIKQRLEIIILQLLVLIIIFIYNILTGV